jgi:hypothetical protein
MDLRKLATERSLAFHGIIARRLLADPGILTVARARVRQWLKQTGRLPRASEGVNELGEYIPLLEKEGCLRHQ